MMRYRLNLCLLVTYLACASVSAHELKTVTLRLDEAPTGAVLATLMTPLGGEESPTAVVPVFDKRCHILGNVDALREAERVVRRWQLQCVGGLNNSQLSFVGLDPHMPEALVIVNFADGRTQAQAIDRYDPACKLSPQSNAAASKSLAAYFPIGIEHILLGPDHLLFVFGLMLVVVAGAGGKRQLFTAITAFTIAHSLTLALAVLGLWGLPPKPVEILIAASILLLAIELSQQQRRQQQHLPMTLTLRQPWLVAFVFGLLHGFGFAGALSAVGLPNAARGLALLFFNLGVEAGQLIFVVLAWQIMKFMAIDVAFRSIGMSHSLSSANTKRVQITLILLGGFASYWLLDRTAIWFNSSYYPLTLRLT